MMSILLSCFSLLLPVGLICQNISFLDHLAHTWADIYHHLSSTVGHTLSTFIYSY